MHNKQGMMTAPANPTRKTAVISSDERDAMATHTCEYRVVVMKIKA
jgi:hypothetical protein